MASAIRLPGLPFWQLVYKPKKNITTWELARCTQLILSSNTRGMKREDVRAHFESLPYKVRRHFKVGT